jgi:hypothetical protein
MKLLEELSVVFFRSFQSRSERRPLSLVFSKRIQPSDYFGSFGSGTLLASLIVVRSERVGQLSVLVCGCGSGSGWRLRWVYILGIAVRAGFTWLAIQDYRRSHGLAL